MPAHAWVETVVAELDALPNMRRMIRTTVIGVYDGGVYGVLERAPGCVQRTHAPFETFGRIMARGAVLAAGRTNGRSHLRPMIGLA